MADEPKEQPDEISGILSELDSILSGLGDPGAAPPAKPAASAPPVIPPAAVPPAEAPKPLEAVKPAPAAPASEPRIELAPRDASMTPHKTEPPKPVAPPKTGLPVAHPPIEISLGTPAPIEPKPVEPLKPVAPPPAAAPAPVPAPAPVAKVEPPKPVEAAKPVEAPKPVEPPKPAAPPPAAAPAATPAAAAAPAGADEIPPTTPKDQIRRVAYIYTFVGLEARAGLATFLSQAARTISKKPLFLRQVLAFEVGAQSDPEAVCQKAREAKAVALLAVVDGWPSAKIDALSEACQRGGLLFRSIPPGDVQKKSTAVDVIVDMMLLPGES